MYRYEIDSEQEVLSKQPLRVVVRKSGSSVILQIKKDSDGRLRDVLTLTPYGEINLLDPRPGTGLLHKAYVDDYLDN